MRVVVASEAVKERARLRRAALAHGLICEPDDCSSLGDLPGRLKASDADLALVAVGLDLAAALQSVQGCVGLTPAFGVCDPFDAPAVLRAGARGYIRSSAVEADLSDAIEALGAGGAPTAFGRVIAITSGRPGAGATTVASHLAFALAARQRGTVTLAQFAETEDLAENLAVESSGSWADATGGWYRLDPQSLGALLVRHPGGIDVLAGGPASPAVARHVVDLLRSRSRFVVLDLGHRIDPSGEAVVRLADTVAVVTGSDRPSHSFGLRQAARLGAIGVCPDRLVVVLNRAAASDRLAEVMGAWPAAHAAVIPDDTHAVRTALDGGGAWTADAFAELAELCSGARDARRTLAA